MPLIGQDQDEQGSSLSMQNGNVTGTGFQFSAQRPDTLGSTEYTLVVIAVDTSGSVAGFKRELEAALKAAIESCRHSPRADSLLIRVTQFSNTLREGHGFKELSACNPGDYDNCLKIGGLTALYDATIDAVGSVIDHGTVLVDDHDFEVNAIVFVLTDGMENASTFSDISVVKDRIAASLMSEKLESIRTILLGVNVCNVTQQYLDDFKRDAGFDQYESVKDATPRSLAKIADFVSRSISSQSQSLGTGGPSASLGF